MIIFGGTIGIEVENYRGSRCQTIARQIVIHLGLGSNKCLGQNMSLPVCELGERRGEL